jgi:hypothetical protein
MDPAQSWQPVRWPDGPFWRKPASLDLLKGTPVNCVVVGWSGDAGRNAELEPLLAAGRNAGLSFAGWLEAEADKGPAIEAAKRYRLAALLMDEPAEANGVSVIPVAERAKMPWDSRYPVLATKEGMWPGVKASAHGGDAADAGPTGLPWIDSNAWFVRLARALAPEKQLWLAYGPPKEAPAFTVNSYLTAVADSMTGGARWLLSLDQGFCDGLASSRPQALEGWKLLARSIGFFEKHSEWRGFRPAAALGVVSDFSRDSEFLAGEALNLLARRQLAHQILVKSRAGAALGGLQAILYVDRQPPEAELRRKLLEFVQSGGLLIAQPPAAAELAVGVPSEPSHPRFNLHSLGQGRVAIAKADFSDPYVLAADAHTLLSRRHDQFRIWNGGATVGYFAVSADGARAVLQVLSYSSQPASFLSVRFARPYRRGRLWTLDQDAPASVDPVRVGDSVEFHLPAFSVYAGLELET